MKRYAAVAASVLFLMISALGIKPGICAQGNTDIAPDFQLTDLTGKTIKLADYKGKVLFLNFWATWCPPCRAEIPDFIKAYQEQKANGLEILGISLDTTGKDAILAFVNKYKINYPIVLESKSKTEQVIDEYQPGQFIPTTIIIDKQGRIRHKQVGQMDKDILLRYFNQLKDE